MALEGWDAVLTTEHVVENRERSSLEKRYAERMTSRPELGRLAGPTEAQTLPVHRWALYKEAYAPGLVDAILDVLPAAPTRLLDVFAGVGTTLLTGRERRIETVGVERLPYAFFVAQTKLDAHRADVNAVDAAGRSALASRRKPVLPAAVPAAEWALAGEARDTLGTLYGAIVAQNPSIERDLALLALLSIVEEASQATKDGTSVRRKLPGRRRGRWGTVVSRDDVQAMFRRRLDTIVQDVAALDPPEAEALIVQGDARDLPAEVLAQKSDAAVFSPPYPNRYDYSAIYQLELAYGFVKGNCDLKELRHSMLRSHLEAPSPKQRTVEQPALDEFLHALLARKRAGDQSGRTFRMVSGYFEDMRQVLRELTMVLRPGSHVAIVVATQSFNGQHLPTDLLLAAMAEDVGMSTEEIWVMRTKGIAVQQRTRWGNATTRESVVRLVV